VTLLDHYREDLYLHHLNGNATFWVKINESLSEGENTTIYIYYGADCANAADSASNGTSTFVFFDDFEDQDLDEWKSGTSWEIVNDQAAHGNYSAFCEGNAANRVLAGSLGNISEAVMIHLHTRVTDSLGYAGYPIYLYGTSASGTQKNVYSAVHHNNKIQYYQNGYSEWPYNNASSNAAWYELEIGLNFTSAKQYGWNNGSYMGCIDLRSGDGINMTDLDDVKIVSSPHNNKDMWIDTYFVRKWVESEPTHDSWSLEELVLDGWSYRKNHTLDFSSGAGRNYQMRFVVHSGNGTDDGENVYLNNHAQSDFDDVRFLDGNCTKYYYYWRESYTSNDEAVFWVKISDNLNSSVSMKIYYGNEEATCISNPQATFIFFDDFEDAQLHWWTTPTSDTSWETVDDVYAQGSNAAYCAGGAVNRTISYDVYIDYSVMIHFWGRTSYSLQYAGYPCWGSGDKDGSGTTSFYSMLFHSGTMRYYQGTYESWPYNNTYTVNTWYEFDVALMPDTDKQRAWKSGQYMGEIDFNGSDGSSTFQVIRSLKMSAGSSTNRDLWIDEFYVRKWLPTEPSHGLWSNEESL
jgi:hypothetical protein